MYVSEHLEKAKSPLLSYEIVPPPRGCNLKDIIDIVEELIPFNPSWIDVTSHSSQAIYHERHDGSIEKRTLRKRPGTIGICGVIQNRFKVDTVAHILCSGFTREETEDALIELNFLGIHNVLALRGDTPNYQKLIDPNRSKNSYAADLVQQLADLKNGKFLNEVERAQPLEYCVGVAGYPEKHFEAPNLRTDILNLKKKVDAGAQYIVTQMFFDSKRYHEFVQQCREAGINVPIVPGIKILKSLPQLKSLARTFHIDLPDELVNEVQENPTHVSEIGKKWAIKQSYELLEMGAPCLHYYVLNDVKEVAEIARKLKL